MGKNYLNELHKNPLVGKWFHSHNEKGEIQWQGQVLGVVSDNHFLVQLYSWLDGTSTDMKIVSLEKIIEEDWSFYSSDKKMRERYEEIRGTTGPHFSGALGSI